MWFLKKKYCVLYKPIILANSVHSKKHKQIFLVKIIPLIWKLQFNVVKNLALHPVSLEPVKIIDDVGYRIQFQILNNIKL